MIRRTESDIVLPSIKFKYVAAAFAVLALFSVCFVIGFLKRVFLIPAAVLIGAYVFIDRKYLRCPNCGAFSNIDRLFYARNNIYHCHSCGERITVE